MSAKGTVLLFTLSFFTKSSPLFFKTCGVIWGTFQSTKTSDNFEAVRNATEVSWESFHKIPNLSNLSKSEQSTKIPEIPGRKSNGMNKELPKMLVYLARLSSFLETPHILKLLALNKIDNIC